MDDAPDRFDDDGTDDDILIPGGWSPGRPGIGRPWIALALVAVSAALVAGWVDLYTDWLWFASVGYQTVFSTVLATKVAAAAVAGLVAAAATYASLRLALRLAPSTGFAGRVVRIDGRPVRLPDAGRVVSALAIPAAALAGLV